MLTSMTGYGVAEGNMLDTQVRVEIRSLNSRYFDFSSRIPSFLIPIENEIKNLIQATIKRGKVSLFISVNGNNSFPSSFSLDHEKIAFYIAELKKVAKKEKLQGDIALADCLKFPDIFVTTQKQFTAQTASKYLFPVVKEAVKNICMMREKEGAHIVKDIQMRLKKIESITAKIEKSAHKEPARIKERLEERLQKNNINLSLNPERLEQEIAYIIDKADITEEITRLRSHCAMFRSAFDETGEIGKRLEFICQEMNRETNTIGSKTQSVEISQSVISIKLEIEKIREQIQNIE
jgi:uncharacterized protein (TIGR00255 family)